MLSNVANPAVKALLVARCNRYEVTVPTVGAFHASEILDDVGGLVFRKFVGALQSVVTSLIAAVAEFTPAELTA
jgi:hypothetical protein